MATIWNAQSALNYLDMQACVGITKHNGGFGATDELLSLCHIKDAQEALNVGCGIGVGSAYVARAYDCRVVAKCQALYARRPHFARRVLQSHLERDILPGLALYQVLLEETGTQEDALGEVGDLFEVAPAKNRSMPPLPGDSSELGRFRLDVLAAYGAPELALAFCSGDDK